MMVNRLIFEGPDDKHVVVNLLYNHDLNGERLSESYNIDEKKATCGQEWHRQSY